MMRLQSRGGSSQTPGNEESPDTEQVTPETATSWAVTERSQLSGAGNGARWFCTYKIAPS